MQYTFETHEFDQYCEFMLKLLERFENNDLMKVEKKEFERHWEKLKEENGFTKDIEVIEYLKNHAWDDFFLFTWDYEKMFYDVRTPKGEIIEKCWANAWMMIATDWTDRSWGNWSCEIRVSKEQ